MPLSISITAPKGMLIAAGSDATHSTTEGFGRLRANSLNTFVSRTYCLGNGLKETIRAILGYRASYVGITGIPLITARWRIGC